MRVGCEWGGRLPQAAARQGSAVCCGLASDRVPSAAIGCSIQVGTFDPGWPQTSALAAGGGVSGSGDGFASHKVSE